MVAASSTLSPPERALARERERVRALREVGMLLDSTVPRDELLRRALSAAARVTEAERATLYLVEPDGKTLVSHATEGGDGTERIVVKIGEGIAGTCAAERRSVSAPDAYGDPRFMSAWDERTGYRTRSILASPMLNPDGSLLGVLQVLNRRDTGGFDEDDVSMLEALAAQAAVAIDAARQMQAIVDNNRDLSDLRRKLERSLRERNLLLGMEQLLSRAESLDEFLDGSLAAVMRECGTTSGAVVLRAERNAGLVLRAARGDHAEPAAAIGSTVSAQTTVAHVIEKGIESLSFGAADAGARSVLSGEPQSLLVVGLPGEQGTIGAIELRDRGGGPFTADDVDLLTLVAANVSTGVALAQARVEREHASRLAAVGHTLSNVVHDLRTPMTIISGYAQLMPDVDSADERERLAQAIVRQFDHMQALIGELLAFVRGESQLLLTRVFVDAFFTETVETLRQELAQRGVKLVLEVNEKGAARFDTAKITRLVHNLARNAADALATRGGGEFRIRVDRDGPDLVLVFEDDGPGIPEGVRQQLFASFVTEGKRDGTGLGLAIVKRVVDDHHGTVNVETGDWGTRFTVRIPALPRQTPSEMPT